MKTQTLGETIRKLREQAGWSQSELARRVGVYPQNIQQLENDTVKQPRYLKDLARVFHKSMDELLEDSKSTHHARKKEIADYDLHLARRIASSTPEQIRVINLLIDADPEKAKALLVLLDNAQGCLQKEVAGENQENDATSSPIASEEVG